MARKQTQARLGARPSARRSRRTALHTTAGFVIGLLAVATGFAFAGTGLEISPSSHAAQVAATNAAIELAHDPAVRPSAASTPAAAVAPQPLLPAAQRDLLIRPEGATRVVVPAVGIDATVEPVGYTYQGGHLDYDVPLHEAGHYVGSADPGDPGNVVIAGHVATRSGIGIFENLPKVKAGDIVEVYRGGEIYRYSVVEIRVVAPDATNVMAQTHDATLTLITCFPTQNFQHRLVVIGKLV
jgi:LPXTG-site transpeptidase (sortase) family protein